MIQIFRRVAVVMSAVALVGCGGGESTPAPREVVIPIPKNQHLGGTVSGLASGETVVLGNGSEQLTVAANGPFEFVPRSSSDVVTVTVLTQPGAAHQCAVNDVQHPDQTSAEFAFASDAANAIEVSCGAFPAFAPPLPQVLAKGGTAASIAGAKVLPVYFLDTPDQALHSQFLRQLVGSSQWTVLREYGVGPATVLPSVTLPSAAPAQLNQADAQIFVSAHMAEWNPTMDSSVYVMLYLPPATINDYVACGGGYHSQVGVQGKQFAWALVTGCNGVERIAQHELMEGLADPDGWSGFTSMAIDRDTWAMAAGNKDAEVGDLCELFSTTLTDVPGVSVQPIWSNLAAAMGAYPCVSGPNQRSLLVGGVPVLQDLLTNTRDGSQLHGLVLAPGSSITIPVRVFSTQPISGRIQLTARTTGWSGYNQTRPELALSLDKTLARNGDTVNLTIGMPAAPFVAWTAFSVTATYGSTSFSFPGAVANTSSF